MSTTQIARSLSAPLLARFASLSQLGERERQMLRALGERAPQVWSQNAVLPARDDDGGVARFIVSGWAAHVRVLRDGRRQIINILLPGDFFGLSCVTYSTPTRMIALSPLRTVQAQEAKREWRDRFREPILSAVLELMAAEDALFMHNHVVRLGRQSAYERIANLIVELNYRITARDRSAACSFPLPITQETIADIVGLSVVHVNRTLQEMRREGRIELRNGRLKILLLNELIEAGEFVDPAMQSASAGNDAGLDPSGGINLQTASRS